MSECDSTPPSAATAEGIDATAEGVLRLVELLPDGERDLLFGFLASRISPRIAKLWHDRDYYRTLCRHLLDTGERVLDVAEAERKKHERTDEDLVARVEEAQRLHDEEGVSFKEAASRVGLSYGQLRKQRSRYGRGRLAP